MENQVSSVIQSSPKSVFKSPLNREVLKEISQNLNAAAGQATHADPVLTNESPTTPNKISVPSLQSKNSKISDESSDSSLDYGSANEDSAPRDDSLVHAFNEFNLNTPKSVKTNQKEPIFLTPFEESLKKEYTNTPTNDVWQEENFDSAGGLDHSEPIAVEKDALPVHRKKIFNVLTESFETPNSSAISDLNLSSAQDNCEIGQDPLSALVYNQESSNDSTVTDINVNQADNVSVEEVSALGVPVDVTSSVSTDAVEVPNQVNIDVRDDTLKENIENGNYDITQDEGIAVVTTDEQEDRLTSCELDVNKLPEDSIYSEKFETTDQEAKSVKKLPNVSFEKNISFDIGSVDNNELPQESCNQKSVQPISNELIENCHDSYDISQNIIEYMKEISAVKNTINSLLEGKENLNNSFSFTDNGKNDTDSLCEDTDIPQSEGIAIIEDENFGESGLDTESDSLTTLNQCIDKIIECSQSEEENRDTIERLDNQFFENIEKSCNNREESKSDSQVNDEAALEILISQVIENTNELEVICKKNDDSINLISDVKLLNSNLSDNSSEGLIDSEIISEIDNIVSNKCSDNVPEPMECDDYILPHQENGDNIKQYVPTVSIAESFVNGSLSLELNTNPFETKIGISKSPVRDTSASTLSNSVHLSNSKTSEGSVNNNLDGNDKIKWDDSEPMECDVSFNVETHAISDVTEKPPNVTQDSEENKLIGDINFKTEAKLASSEREDAASLPEVTLSDSKDTGLTSINSHVSKSECNFVTSEVAGNTQSIEINKSLEEGVEDKPMILKIAVQSNSVSQEIDDISPANLPQPNVECLPLAEDVIASKPEGDFISGVTENTQIFNGDKPLEEDNCFKTQSKILNSPEQVDSTSQKVSNVSILPILHGFKHENSTLVEKIVDDNIASDDQLRNLIDSADVTSVNIISNLIPEVEINKISDPLKEEIPNVSEEIIIEKTAEVQYCEKNESYTDKPSTTNRENHFVLENIHDTTVPLVKNSNDIGNTNEKVLTPHNNIVSSESDLCSLNPNSYRGAFEIQDSISSEGVGNFAHLDCTEVIVDSTFAGETPDDDNLVLDVESDILNTDLDGLESTDSDAVSVCSSIIPSDFNPFETRCKISNTPERDMDTTLTLDTTVSEFEPALDVTLVKQNNASDNFKNPKSKVSNEISASLPSVSLQKDSVSQLLSGSSTDDQCNANLTSFNMSIASGDFVKNSASFKHNLERMNDVAPDYNENTPKSANIIRSEISKQSASAHTLASPMSRDRRLNHLTKKTTRLSPMSRCGDLMGMSPVSHEAEDRDSDSPTVKTNDLLTGDRFAYSNIIDDLKEEFKMPGEYSGTPLLPISKEFPYRDMTQPATSLFQALKPLSSNISTPFPPMRLLHQLVFKDPAAFDYLLSCSTGGGRDLCKESLLVRFDPLVGTRGGLPTGPRPGRQQADLSPPKPEEDASTASGLVESCSSDSSLCTSNSEQAKILSTMSSVEQSLGALSLQSQGVQQHSAANCSTPQGITTSIVNVTTQPTEKPTQVVTPAISTRQQYLPSTPLSSKNAPTPAKSVSSALAAIDRLISLGGSPPPPPVVVQPKEPDMDPRLMAELQSVRELLSRQEEELRQSEERAADIQKQLKDAIAREHALIDRVNEKNRDHRQMDMVMEEYERTMSQFIGERETEKRQWAEERAALIRERDEANSHLANMEHSFNDIHAKYERCKAMVQGYKTNEEVLKETVRLNEEASKKQLERYEQFRQHAMSQLEIANQEIDTVKRSSQSEVIKLQAMLKKSDIQIASLQESLSQKVKDIEDLTAICDDLIQKVA